MTEASAGQASERHADLIIVGGGLGGISACLAALGRGHRVILVEALDWLGGQLTAQGVPPDEHPWIEQFSASQTYARLRHAIREHYRRHMPLTAQARAQMLLNPGQGNVSSLCHEPRVAAAVLDAWLAPYEAEGRLTVLREHRITAAEVAGDRVLALRCVDRHTGLASHLQARMFVDATETGDLLPLVGAEQVYGAESRAITGELHATDEADPYDQQALTWCLAAEYFPDEHHVIDRPPAYERFRTLQLDCWPGPQFSWILSDFVTHQPRERPLFAGPTDEASLYDLWHARRIAWRKHFAEGAYRSDITLANWPQMDYWLQPVIGVPDAQRDQALDEARQFSLSFFYWMQTEAPRHDKGYGYPGLKLRGDVLGTSDGLAKQAYFREGRRIQAAFTILEQHIGVKARSGRDAAETFFDSVGIGAYRIDLHPSTRGRNTVDIDAYPFQIPLGALLPVRLDNFLPACKNIGTTRITNGAYREHATEWSIGEACGHLASFALEHQCAPRAVRERPEWLAQLQQELQQQGVVLQWPRFGALTPTLRTGYRFAAR